LTNSNFWEKEWGGSLLCSHGTTSSRRVAIAIKKSLQHKILSTLTDPYGRFLFAEVKIYDKSFCLANVYGPNNDNPLFYEEFLSKLVNFSSCEYIIGGDYNLSSLR